jgi:hypothetical protein
MPPKNWNGAVPTASRSLESGKKPLVPMISLPLPKAMPKPTAQ